MLADELCQLAEFRLIAAACYQKTGDARLGADVIGMAGGRPFTRTGDGL
jgi:hypothetical protein